VADITVNQAFADMAAARAARFYGKAAREKKEPEPAAPGDRSRAGYEFRIAGRPQRREASAGSYAQRMLRLARKRGTCTKCGALRGERCVTWKRGEFGKYKVPIRGFHQGRPIEPEKITRMRTVRKPPPGAVYR